MKKTLAPGLLILLVFLTVGTGRAASDAPHEIGGVRLGSDITDYPHIEYSNFLKDVVVSNWNGFARGMISYGICERPGKISRVRFKYRDVSKKFYTSLLNQYKKKYGKPDHWEGDAFGIQHVWKWSFKDKDNNRIEMVLQHNLKDTRFPIGTFVTLSYPDRIEAERQCFNRTMAANCGKSEHSDCGPACPLKPRPFTPELMLPR